MGSVLARSAGPGKGSPQVRYARRANAMGKLLFLVTLPYAPLFAYWGAYWLAGATGIANLAYLAPLWLNRLGRDIAARVSTPLVATVLISVVSLTFGRDTDVHLALFVMLGWAFQLFDVRTEWKPLSVVVCVPALAYAGLQLAVLPPLSGPALSEATRRMLSMGFGISTMLTFTVTLAYFYVRNQDNEKSLERSVDELVASAEERRKTQINLEVAHDRARRASAAKGEFLAMVSHELCGPLHGILGSLEELRQQPLEEEGRELVQLLQSSGDHLALLIQGLLDFVGMDRDDFALAKDEIDLAALIAEVVASLAPRAHEKQLELDLRLDVHDDRLLVGDAERIRQLSAHIIENAIRYTPRGWVMVALQLGSDDGERAQITLRVDDTGPGVPLQLRDKLFAPFEQAATFKHRGTEGLGLGLAICRKIATAMDGEIDVVDRPEGGTCVTTSFELPVSTSPAQRPRPLAGRTAFVEMQDERAERCLRATLHASGAQLTNLAQDADLHFVTPPFAPERGHTSSRHCHVTATARPELSNNVVRPVTPRALERLASVVTRLGAPASASTEKLPSVLIAEDNNISLRLISHMMKRFGYRVVGTKDGREAIEAWRREPFDLALLDVQMPELDGLDVAREIRASEQQTEANPGASLEARKNTPIVIITANVAPEQAAEAAAIGVDAYLNKPCPAENLAATLRQLNLPVKGSTVRRASGDAPSPKKKQRA